HTILDDGEVEKTLFMSGGKDFRPVAMDKDSGGNLFISDWVLVDYPNHGRGKIWRVSKLPIPEPDPQPAPEQPKRRTIKQFLSDRDPFVRHQGEMWLAKGNRKPFATRLSQDEDPMVRLGAFLALKRMGAGKDRDLIRAALRDESIEVRRMALLWAGQALDVSLRPALDQVLTAGEVTPTLFKCYLAAVEMVNDHFIEEFKKRETNSKKVKRELEPGLLLKLARDSSFSPVVRAEAVKRLNTDEAMEFLYSAEESVLLAAISKLAAITESVIIKQRFTDLALDRGKSGKVRAEALLALSKQAIEDPSALVSLLRDSDRSVANEATRTLRNYLGDPMVKQAFTSLDKKSNGDPGQDAVVSMVMHGFSKDRPTTVDAWKNVAVHGGDPDRGSRVFRTTQSMCTLCHAVDGEGTKLGPDLGGIAQSITPEQIVQAVLRPSDSFPPQYQAWNIYTTDGKVHTGLQIDHQRGGAMLLYTMDNYNRRFEADEVKNYEASPYSLMPQGLENTMTANEFRDLIAYLSSLK
ncbi:MAG: HEAT repeat domain-containing protein, partial [Verrucomicrobiae bacterium]|nr:HEAT repeat domain-containing protein [Verrucomicrobiae bacterium]